MTPEQASEAAEVAINDQRFKDAKVYLDELRAANVDLQYRLGQMENAYKVTKGYMAYYMGQLMHHRIIKRTAVPYYLLSEVTPYFDAFELGQESTMKPETLAETIKIVKPRVWTENGYKDPS